MQSYLLVLVKTVLGHETKSKLRNSIALELNILKIVYSGFKFLFFLFPLMELIAT